MFFFAEECERKIIVGHSVPKILYSGSSDASGFSSNAEERIVATKDLYRRNINPLRKVVLDGLTKLFRLIDPNVKLEFVDFEEFRDVQEEVTKEDAFNADVENAKAQATLRGSVGGVSSILEIQAAYVAGTTSYGSAIAMLQYIFGFDELKSKELLGTPKEDTTPNENIPTL